MFEDAVWFLVCCLWWTQVSWGKQMNNKFGHWEMEYLYNYIWLMVLTILKNMKVNGKAIYDGKIKNGWNHQPAMYMCIYK